LDKKYKLLTKKDNYVYFIENTILSKSMYDLLKKYFIFDISKEIDYQKKIKIKTISILVFQLDLKENILIDFDKSNINNYLNNNMKKEKIVKKKMIKSGNKKECLNEDDDDDTEEEKDSDYNSDFNDLEFEEDELKDIDYENENNIILDELEELEREENSDFEDDDVINSNNTIIYLKNNIIQKEIDINNDYTQLYNTRKKTIDIFKKIIKNINIIRKIELSILNYCIDKCKKLNVIPTWDNPNVTYIYINKGRHLYENLNPKSYIQNDYLIKEIQKKEFDLLNIAYLKREEIMPSKWIPLIEENKHKEEIINQSHSAASTELYVCPNRNCRARKAVYKEVQTRSADEPMTLFLTCLVCGKKWKY